MVLEVVGGDVDSGYEGKGGRRVGGWPDEGGDVTGGLYDVFPGQAGPLCNKIWDIHPPSFCFGGPLVPTGEACHAVTINHYEILVKLSCVVVGDFEAVLEPCREGFNYRE